MLERLAGAPDFHLVMARAPDGRPAAFKCGFREGPLTFYSWLGGVLPEFRRQGLGRRLMERQHAWCRERGYRYVRTKTRNQWRSMLILNLTVGFEIIGIHTGRDGTVKILMEKKLSDF
jgi:GNAT superfamily N-acetyltransferase